MFKSIKKLKNHVRLALVNILKSSFTSNTDYPYTTSVRTRKIDITLDYPEKLTNPDNPIVVIDEASGDFSRKVVGRKFVRDVTATTVIAGMTVGLTFYPALTVTAVTAQIFGETIPFTVPITAVAQNSSVVDDIQNTIIEYLMDEDLVGLSGLLITDVRATSKGETIIGNDVFINGGVELELLTCYETTTTIADSDRIGKITATPYPINLDGATM